MADRIKGITVQLGGDTTGLDKALKSVNSSIRETQSQLKDVNRLLKLDPSNTKLLAQKHQLLQGEISGTKEKLQSLKEAEKQVQKQFAQGKVSQEQYSALQREIADTENKLKSLKKEAGSFGSVWKQALGAVGDKLKDVGSKLTSAGKSLLPVTGAITAAGAAGIASASSFESSMAKLSTIADANEVSLESLRSNILDVSNAYGIGAADIAEAAYSAISAGRSTGEAVNFVTDSVKLAKGGFTDIATAVDTLTTIMNAYGDGAGTAEEISNRLITTQNLGKTTVAELGAYMGKVIPTAAMYGVNLDNLASAYVTTTKNGIQTADSTTYINSMLNELGKSGSTAGDILKEKTGQSFAELMNSGMSLYDALAIVQAEADSTGKSIGDMFSSQEAGKAAATITQHADVFSEAMNTMKNSTGAARDAFAQIDDTTTVSMEKLKTSAQNIAISFGELLLPTLESVMEKVQSVLDWFNGLDESQKKMIVTILAVVAAIGPLLIILGTIAGAIGSIITLIGLIATPVGLVVAAVVAAGVAIAAVVVAIITHIDEIKAGFEKFIDRCGDMWENCCSMSLKQWEEFKEGFKGVVNGIIGFVNGMVSAVVSGVNTVIRAINSLSFDVPDWIPGIGGKHFGFDLSELEAPQIPLLAKGGTLLHGSAIVGEAGPELLTRTPHGTRVTPLGSDAPRAAGNSITINARFSGYAEADARRLVRLVNRELGRVT